MPLTKVTSGLIAANAVVDSFGTQSITGDKLGLTSINANNIVNGTITGTKIALGTITGDDIAVNQITGNLIATGQITGNLIATGQITGNLLTANCVAGNNIVANTITANLLSTTIYASNSDIFGVSANANTFGNNIIIVAGNTSVISVGDVVSGSNIAPNTVVTSINSSPPSGRSNLTISNAAAGSNTNTTVSFYSTSKILSPGIAGPGLCKAWVNFNGTGAVQLRAAYNVSSITDNGTGDYTVNFTNAMPNNLYSAIGSCCLSDAVVAGNTERGFSPRSYTTTSVRFIVTDSASGVDPLHCNIVIFL